MFARIAFIAALAAASPALGAEFKLKAPGLAGGFPSENLQAAAYGLGCSGGNISPAVSWSGAPEGTKSFVVTLYDRDAPTGSGFWHWAVANVPAGVSMLAKGAGSGQATLPHGAVTVRSDLGVPGYVGPCPPLGSRHRYVLTVTALSVPALKVDANSTPEIVGFMAGASAIGRAKLEIAYGR
jgi:Raf kinase inhibitor-like YbhB/YbcL family protein